MIRRFMLISGSSGLLLFRSSFEGEQGQNVPESRSNLMAGLLTALVDFTKRNVGLSVTHIRFEKDALHIADVVAQVRNNQQERVICCVLSDGEDDERFGRLIASELLFAFVREYAEKLSDMRSGDENFASQFIDFSSKVYFIVEKAVIPLMKDLEEKEGIKQAILLKNSRAEFEDNLLSSLWYPQVHSQHTTVLAEVQNFLNVADDIMSDHSSSTVSAKIGDSIAIRRLERGTFIVVCRSARAYESTLPAVESCISLLQCIFRQLDYLKGL